MTDSSIDGPSATPLVLVNPRASELADPDRRDQIVEAGRARRSRQRYGRAPRIESGTLEATRAALAAADRGAPLVVVVGGDGTVREAAAALVGRDDAAGDRPGRDRQRPRRRHRDPRRALGPRRDPVRTAAAPRPRAGALAGGRGDRTRRPTPHERLFTVACGMGLDARIMAAAEHEWKRRMRFGAYIGAAVRELARLETARFRIVADGEPIEIDGYLVLVANAGELVPGRIGPRQPIDPTDGRLDLIVLGGGGAAGGPARCGRAHAPVRRPRAAGSSAAPIREVDDRGRTSPADRDRRRPAPAGRLEVARRPGRRLRPGPAAVTRAGGSGAAAAASLCG